MEDENGEDAGHLASISRPPTPVMNSGKKKKRKEMPEMSEKRVTVSIDTLQMLRTKQSKKGVIKEIHRTCFHDFPFFFRCLHKLVNVNLRIWRTM